MSPSSETRRRSSRTLYAYLTREMLFPTFFALGGFAFVVLMKDLLAYSELVINRGVGLPAVGAIAFYSSVPTLARILPFAVLVGSLSSLGRLGADREILALEASGSWARRLVAPVVLFAAGMTTFGLALSLVAAPWATRTLDAKLIEMVSRNPGAAIQAGVVHKFEDWKLEAREVSADGEQLHGVMLWMPSVGETVFAERARVEAAPDGGTRLTLEAAQVVLNPREGARQLRLGQMETHIPKPREAQMPSDWLARASMSELAEIATSTQPRARNAHAEWHRRIALPVATLFFGFLAVPLFVSRGHFSRSGGAMLGLLTTLVYYGLVQLGNGFMRSGALPVAAAMWLPNLLLFGAGLLLFARSARFSAFGRDADRVGRFRQMREKRGGIPRIRIHRMALARYVMRRFLHAAVMCFGVLLVAFLIVDVLDNLKWFTKYDATLGEVLRFYGARILVIASRVVPIALLVAAALNVSLLAVQGEVMGMRACGISAAHALLPVLVLCGAFAVFYFFLTNDVVPHASARASEVKQTEIKNRGDESRQVRTQVWYRVGDNVYEAEELNPLKGVAWNITWYKLGSDGLPRTRTDARMARHMGAGIWRLIDPVSVEIDNTELRLVQTPSRAQLGHDVPAETDTAHLSLAELRREIEESERDGNYAATEYRVALHAKLAAPLMCLVLPAIAILFAVGGPPFPTPVHTLVLSAVMAVSHVMLLGVGAALGKGGAISPILAGWGPAFLLTSVATWLGFRVRGFGQSFF